jgi:hypothetical protein
MNSKLTKSVFMLFWLAFLAYLIFVMTEICAIDQTDSSNTEITESSTPSSTSADPVPSTTSESFDNNNLFDYTENFEPNDSSDLGDYSAPTDEVADQDVNFEAPLDNSDNLLQNIEQENEDDELVVEGTDALIAASSDRFYSVDTKGQTNRNASNDLRGDLPIAYNENYTPFNQSAIYGEPLVPAGRL